MVRRLRAPKLECAVIDLNTQCDFLDHGGARPVANLEQLIPALRKVIAWTKRNGTPVISSIESHRFAEMRKEEAPPHCLDGSKGQRKIDFTVFPKCERVEFDNTLCVPLDLFADYQQIIFRKRDFDLLGNPKADRFLTQLQTQEYILFGVGLERSIKVLTLGLLARQRRVTVVANACGYWDEAEADLALRQITAKGAEVIMVDELMQRRLVKRIRAYRKAPSINEEAAMFELPEDGECEGTSAMDRLRIDGHADGYADPNGMNGSNGNGSGKVDQSRQRNGQPKHDT